MIEFMAAQHAEWATLIHWCRQQGVAPVAIGGSSLGAQTAKALAVNAWQWPQQLRSDALFAITHCAGLATADLLQQYTSQCERSGG